MSGVTVFETMAVRGGRVPLLDRHLARLRQAAETLDLPSVPDTIGAEAGAQAGRGGNRILRLAWSVAGARWSDRALEGPERWTVAVVGEPHPGYPVKTEAREAFDRALAAARERGADEALLATPAGTLVEATRFALVWVEDDELFYPDPELGGLPSVGLARLTETAEDAGVTVRAAWVSADDLADRPLGLVNAARGLVAVASLDGEAAPSSELLDDLAARFWPD